MAQHGDARQERRDAGDRNRHLPIEVVMNRVCRMFGMLDLVFRSV
jgi:hypothetical protein